MTSKFRNELYNEIKDLNIGVLINNVGYSLTHSLVYMYTHSLTLSNSQSYSYPQYFDVLGDLSNEVDSKTVNNKNLQETIPVSDISAIMSLNVWSTTHMTAVVLPLMVKKGYHLLTYSLTYLLTH
jgi:short-subunit dehydrogenase